MIESTSPGLMDTKILVFAGPRIPKRGEKIKSPTGVVETLKQLDVRIN